MRDDPVVITGAGLVSALGHSAAETWTALLAGRQARRPIEGFDASGFPGSTAAQITGLDPPSAGLHQRWTRSPDLHLVLLMKCAREAFQQAKLDLASPGGEELGLFIGTGMVDCNLEDLLPAVLASRDSGGALDLDAFYATGYQQISPLWPLSMLNNVSVCQVAIELGIRGDNAVFAPDALAGAQAIAEGVKSLQQKKSVAVLAGGVSEKLSPFSLARAHLQGTLDSTIGLGEGAAMLALELRSSAGRRGASFTTAIVGYGAAYEQDPDAPSPTTEAIARAMAHALRRAELTASDIDLILIEGPGGSARQHSHALQEIFGSCRNLRGVYSSQSTIGWLLAGAVPVDAVIGVRMIESGLVPEAFVPSVPQARSDGPIKRVMVSCAGPQGQSAALILEATG
jgi:3-oxoacyl-[acyl-carrier-protein] synthase II